MTHSPLLRSDETLFRDPEVFEFTFVPEQLHHRDAQVRELAVLRGQPGTGKTTYHEHLNGLVRAGIVDLVPGSGRGREVRLRYDPGEVLAVCKPPDRR